VPELPPNQIISKSAFTLDDRDLTLDQALAMRADQARLAAHYASRAERARAAGEYAAMRRSRHEYRRAARDCRLLGERIRTARELRDQAAGNADPAVARITPRTGTYVPPAGEAA
jgi:hypothetical protein